MKRYPIIEFMVKHGRKVALAVAALPVLGGAYGWQASGRLDCWVGGIVLAVLVYGFLRLFVEILDVISETLLPR